MYIVTKGGSKVEIDENLKVDYEITGLAVLSFVVGCLYCYIAALVE